MHGDPLVLRGFLQQDGNLILYLASSFSCKMPNWVSEGRLGVLIYV
jgi:hypothetical protein